MSLPKIDTPVFDFELPGTKDEVKMRLMKVRDEKILLQAKEGQDPGEILSAVKQVVQNCVVTENVNVDDWPIFSLEAAFLQLRAHSVSEIAQTSYIDNEEVDMEMAEVDSASPDYEKKLRSAQSKATRTFDINLKTVRVKFPENLEKTVKVNDKIGIILKYPPASLYSDKDFLKATGDDLVNLLIQQSIETIYDGKNVTDISGKIPDELHDWIENLDVKAYTKIKDFFTQLPHLEHTINYKNKNGKDRSIVLTTLGDFFQL